jgi:hypothetical protein
MGSGRSVVLLLMPSVFAIGIERDAAAGGGWVPAPAGGYVNLAFVDKASSSGWDARGRSTSSASDAATNRDDLKFIALSSEFGVVPGVSALVVVPFLIGREGRMDPLDEGIGFSDLFLGGKVAILEGATAIAGSVIARVPWLYDTGGPYRRFDSFQDQANHKLSSQWRGLLKYDLAFTVHGSMSLADRGWVSLEPGIVLRTGAPSHAATTSAEVGYAFIESLPLALKLFSYVSLSLHTNREPLQDDRFQSSLVYDFNDSSMWKVGASVLWRPYRALWVEGGYSRWVWGRSAREYQEPFVSIGWML